MIPLLVAINFDAIKSVVIIPLIGLIPSVSNTLLSPSLSLFTSVRAAELATLSWADGEFVLRKTLFRTTLKVIRGCHIIVMARRASGKKSPQLSRANNLTTCRGNAHTFSYTRQWTFLRQGDDDDDQTPSLAFPR